MTDAYMPRHAVTRPRQYAAPGPLAAIFRRILGRLRREQAAPGPVAGQGGSPDGATPGAAGHDVLTDAEIAALTPRRETALGFANAVHATSAPFVEDQQPRNGALLGTLPHLGPVRRARQPWYTTPFASPPVPPVYGEAAQLTVAPELARQEAS